jgi:hypothetical protein
VPECGLDVRLTQVPVYVTLVPPWYATSDREADMTQSEVLSFMSVARTRQRRDFENG